MENIHVLGGLRKGAKDSSRFENEGPSSNDRNSTSSSPFMLFAYTGIRELEEARFEDHES